jgi:rhomboid protease GluP
MHRDSSPIAPAESLSRRIPWGTLLLCTATVVVSLYAAVDIAGTCFGRIRIVELEDYGLRLQHLADFEFWRLVTAQLVHVKQAHMPLSVLSMLLVGVGIERHIGFVRLLLLWLVAGSIATLVSTGFVPYPWNLGTGASQAIMAMAGCGVVLAAASVDRTKFLRYSLAFTLVTTFALDLIFAGYPKPGHITGLLLGALMTWAHLAGTECRASVA